MWVPLPRRMTAWRWYQTKAIRRENRHRPVASQDQGRVPQRAGRSVGKAHFIGKQLTGLAFAIALILHRIYVAQSCNTPACRLFYLFYFNDLFLALNWLQLQPPQPT